VSVASSAIPCRRCKHTVRARSSRLGRHYDCLRCGFKRVLYRKVGLRMWAQVKADLSL
jgi:DNA-directed RNA polymerase subunit RPC12/RpoP